MDNAAANPFAEMVEPGLIAQAVARSMQLNLLPRRQYTPLDKPSRSGGRECADIVAGERAVGRDGADGTDAVADIAAPTGRTLRGCWLDGVDDADRFDFVDTSPGGLVAVDPVRRFG